MCHNNYFVENNAVSWDMYMFLGIWHLLVRGIIWWDTCTGAMQTTYLLNHGLFFLFYYAVQSEYGTDYSYKQLTFFTVVCRVVCSFLPIMGKGDKNHWHHLTCRYMPPCSKLLLKCPLLWMILHALSASVWVSDHGHRDWGPESRKGYLNFIRLVLIITIVE